MWITQPKQHKAACLRTGTGASCVRSTDALNRSSCNGTRKLRSGQASADTGFYFYFLRVIHPPQNLYLFIFFLLTITSCVFSPNPQRWSVRVTQSSLFQSDDAALALQRCLYVAAGGALRRTAASWLNWPMGRTKSGQRFVFRGFPYLVLSHIFRFSALFRRLFFLLRSK